MKGADALAQAHLDALPILLESLIACATSGEVITAAKASSVLYRWDQARKPKRLPFPGLHKLTKGGLTTGKT
jgi:hypothetical protein